MKEIKLTKGYVALVDDADYEMLSKHKWCVIEARNTAYAVRASYDKGKKGIVRMHRQILEEHNMKLHIDHIDGNGLNNQRSNLRVCTPSENLRNRGAMNGSKTGIKGISLDKHGKYVASLKIEGKWVYVGYFKTLSEAVAEYNKASEQYHRQFGVKHCMANN